jgi:hypothetical protein
MLYFGSLHRGTRVLLLFMSFIFYDAFGRYLGHISYKDRKLMNSIWHELYVSPSKVLNYM